MFRSLAEKHLVTERSDTYWTSCPPGLHSNASAGYPLIRFFCLLAVLPKRKQINKPLINTEHENLVNRFPVVQRRKNAGTAACLSRCRVVVCFLWQDKLVVELGEKTKPALLHFWKPALIPSSYSFLIICFKLNEMSIQKGGEYQLSLGEFNLNTVWTGGEQGPILHLPLLHGN